MSLKARAIAAGKKRKEKNCQRDAEQTLAVLEDKYGVAGGKIVGECVIVGAGTNNELKFKLNNRYSRGKEVSVWHNNTWHEVYGLESLGDILSTTELDGSAQTTSERLVETLEELMYEIAEGVAGGYG